MPCTRLLFVMLSTVAANLASAADETAALLAKSDPAIQAQIAVAYDTLNNASGIEKIFALHRTGANSGELAEQFAIFAATARDPREFHSLELLVMLNFLEVSPSSCVRVLAPHLDSDNARLRDFAEAWFQSYDHSFLEKPLEAYTSYLRLRQSNYEAVPPEFVEYVFGRLSPGQALRVFHAGLRLRKQQPEVLLAEHLISNAIWFQENNFPDRYQAALPEARAELRKLATQEEWWARLYVVWVMRRHQEFRDEAILELLRKDENPLVNKAAFCHFSKSH